jgi:hypothetical protein
MKTKKLIVNSISVSMIVCWLGISAMAQVQKIDEPVAAIASSPTEITFQPQVAYSRLVLTVAAPSGEVYRKEFEGGAAASFRFIDDKGFNLSDGHYSYELRVIPQLSREARKALAASREKGNSAEVMQELQKSGQLPATISVQSGSFLIENGAARLGAPGEDAEPRTNPNGEVQTQSKKKGGGTVTIQDVVTADDVIIQGSACIGLDCVNNESFGFDTIRLKENNTRIKFDDTSTSAGFPANDWQLTANDSASGGANKFSIEDITGAKVPFTLTAGAPTNSLFVSSTGRVGLRTSTPVLDLHITTGDTPAHRLEQTAGSGFTAQTWDIAGNEANFFVRDVTGGSRLPFRIRPGAPTSSVDISANGNVGIGTASPARKLEVAGTGNIGIKITDTSITNAAFLVYLRNSNGTLAGRQFSILDENVLADRLIINASGFIGIGGLLNPTNPLEHANGAKLTAGGVWTDASSRALKSNIRRITAREALLTLPALNPVKFEYKSEPGETYAGFIAEDVPDLVATSDRKSMSSMDVVAVLTKVVQEQQKTIAELKTKMARIERRLATPARLNK